MCVIIPLSVKILSLGVFNYTKNYLQYSTEFKECKKKETNFIYDIIYTYTGIKFDTKKN